MTTNYELGPRTYGLNLAAYISAVTDIAPLVLLDEETNTYYCRFPVCDEVKAAVIQYKSKKANVNLYEFLSALKRIRMQMHLTKSTDKGGEPSV